MHLDDALRDGEPQASAAFRDVANLHSPGREVRIYDLPSAFSPRHRQPLGIKQSDLHENAGLIPINILVGNLAVEADIKQWDIAILLDGTNLPPGSGTSAQGAKIYAERCVACHAEGGKGGAAPGAGPLVGGAPLTNGIDTLKTIGNYYAYATTVFDYIRRAMPFNMPRSLTDNEVYALTAYILSINKLIGENDVIDAKSLPQVKMPNRDNYIIPYPDRI